MAKLTKLSKKSKKAQKRGTKRAYEYSEKEKRFLKKVGLQISHDLEHRFNKPHTVEWLSWEANVSRSSLCEIIAGRSNFKVITLHAVSDALGYKSIQEFLNAALS